jgi:hypothetical protein
MQQWSQSITDGQQDAESSEKKSWQLTNC